MSISCPHCGHSIEFSDPKVGRFRIRCPSCRGPAILAVERSGEEFRASITPFVEEKKAEPQPAPVAAREPKPLPDGTPRRFGPFRLDGLLGQGSLGDTYLARRGPLGPPVALKVLRTRFSSDAAFVATFNREAFAASRIECPGLIPILGFGDARGLYWVASEYVEGTPFGDLVARGKTPPETAAAWILQAARILRFANDQGMVHRGIHLDQLILDQDGVVHVADLGLVDPLKPGRPAFTAPEVTSEPERVDGRADVYSLGKVLLSLVSGRVAGEAGGEPDAVMIERQPRGMAELIRRMTADRPADRFASLPDLIAAVERFLGIPSSAFMPTDEQVARLEEAAREFNAGPLATWRPWGLLGFHGVLLLFAALFLLAMKPSACVAILGLWAGTIAALVVWTYVFRGSAIVDKGLRLLGTNRPPDWVAFGVGAVVLLALVVVFEGIPLAVFLFLVACGFAAGFHYGVDRPLAALRDEPLSRAGALIAELRAKGVSEDDLRRFVCVFSGRDWEEFHENLFGYDSKRLARERWGKSPGGKSRPRHEPVRDPISDWIEETTRERLAAADRLRLQAVEEAGFVAAGVNLLTARRRARKTADAMIIAADEIRLSSRRARRDPDAIVVTPRPISQVIREAASKPDLVLQNVDEADDGPGILAVATEILVGPRARFLAGAVLVGLCVLWAHQNAVFSAEEIQDQVRKAVESRDVNAVAGVKIDYAKADTKPLSLPILPGFVTDRFNGWGPGASGLFLIVSSFVPGARIAAFAIPAAIVPFLGRSLPIPKIGPLDGTSATAAVGGAILVVGLLFGRSKR